MGKGKGGEEGSRRGRLGEKGSVDGEMMKGREEKGRGEGREGQRMERCKKRKKGKDNSVDNERIN